MFRSFAAAVALAGLVGLFACEDAANESESEQPAREPIQAALGGTLMETGPYTVELRAGETEVDALVFDASGRAVTGADDVQLQLTLFAAAQAQAVPLSWDAALGRFHGRPEPALEMVGAPGEIRLTVSGQLSVAAIPSLVVLPRPAHGGRVLALGDLRAEVLLGADGELQAFVRNARGAKVGAGAKLKLSARLQGVDGARHALDLAWDAERARFAGQLNGIALAPGPLELTAQLHGSLHTGRLQAVALMPAPTASGAVVALAEHSVELAMPQPRLISARLYDAHGTALSGGGANLQARVQLKPGRFERVKLTWHAPSATYRGRCRAGVRMGLPMQVTAGVDGKLHSGALLAMPALAAPEVFAQIAGGAAGNAEATARVPRAHVRVSVPRPPKVRFKASATAGHKAAVKRVSTKAGRGRAGARAKVSIRTPGVSVRVPKPKASAKASAKFKLGR